MTPMHFRLRTAGLHLILSLLVAAVIAALVFGLWYPGAYRRLAGGQSLFLILVTVDVIIGPLLTLAVADASKPRKQLLLDLAVIAALQIAALSYGVKTVYDVRPVALVFEVDRFRMVAADQVRTQELAQAAPAYRTLSRTGPVLLGTRKSSSDKERFDAIELGLMGQDIGQRPLFSQPYETSRAQALQRSRALSDMTAQYPALRADILAAATDAGLTEQTARFLPLLARGEGIVLIDREGQVRGFAPGDGFF